MDTKKAKKFISYLELAGSDDESDGGRQNLYEAVFTLHESVSLEFFYFGNYDENGLFHGQAVLKPNTYNSCFKGECKVRSHLLQWFSTFGSWRPTKQNKTQFGDPNFTRIVLKHRF